MYHITNAINAVTSSDVLKLKAKEWNYIPDKFKEIIEDLVIQINTKNNEIASLKQQIQSQTSALDVYHVDPLQTIYVTNTGSGYISNGTVSNTSNGSGGYYSQGTNQQTTHSRGVSDPGHSHSITPFQSDNWSEWLNFAISQVQDRYDLAQTFSQMRDCI